MKISMCCNLSSEDGQVFKYRGSDKKQFRESLFAFTERIKKELDTDMHFIQTIDFLNDGTFSRYYRLHENTGNELVFKPCESSLSPDIIINKRKDELYSLLINFDLRSKIYNHYGIAMFGNKAHAFAAFSSLMPQSFVVNRETDRRDVEDFIDAAELSICVVKPLRLNGGQGIELVPTNELMATLAASNKPLMIQEYCEAKGGIPGLVNGRHDLRVYIVDGEPILIAVRTPKNDGYIANTSAGGSIFFYDINLLPRGAYGILNTVTSTLNSVTANYFISIDLFFTEKGWKLIGINDQPGLPAPYQTTLADNLFSALIASIKAAQKGAK